MNKFILIVAEDRDKLRRLREILSRAGYDLMTAKDRETAIEICKRVPVSLVLAEPQIFNISG